MEYSNINAYSKCLLPICDVDHTLSPTQSKKPTKFTSLTPEPTTLSPSLNPTGLPTKTWWSSHTHTTTNNDDDNDYSVPTTILPIITPSEDPTTKDPTREPSDYPTENATPWSTPQPSPQPSNIPTCDPITYEPTFIPTILCPIYLADNNNNNDDDNNSNSNQQWYFADPKPPKDIQYNNANSVGINRNNFDGSVLNIGYPSDDDDEYSIKNMKNNNDYSSWTYFILLTFISFNIILCLWFLLKMDAYRAQTNKGPKHFMLASYNDKLNNYTVVGIPAKKYIGDVDKNSILYKF